MTPEQLACDFAEQHPLPDWHNGVTEHLIRRHDATPALERVILRSPSLHARLLALVNSSLYGFPSPIGQLPMASTVLGPQALLELLRVLATVEALGTVQPATLDGMHFWQHAVLTGLLAQQLGRQRGLRNSEILFQAGLLHDVGKLVIHEQLPEQAASLNRHHTSARHGEFRLEQMLLGFDHAAIGAALLKAWSLPEALVSATRSHHRQSRHESQATVALIVAEADQRWRRQGFDAVEHPKRTELELQAVQLHELLFGIHFRPISDMMFS